MAALATDDSAAADGVVDGPSDGYLVVCNIGKKENIKKLLALAVAYGLEHVLIVGQPHFELATHAPPPSVVPGLAERISIRRHPDLASCKAFLMERGITCVRARTTGMAAGQHALMIDYTCLHFRVRLYGVEIVEGARLVQDVDFRGRPSAFMMGNEGSGMNKTQLSACDEFIIIAQYGNGTASLNVSNAAAIVLQYFALSRVTSECSGE